MSVMCSIYVPEGIVMAADSRMTVNLLNKDKNDNTSRSMFSITDNAQKVMLLNKVRIGISACGLGILGDVTIADYIRIFEIQEVTTNDTVSDVAEKLLRYSSKFEKMVKFYVTGYDAEEPFVYAVANGERKRINIKDAKIIHGAAWNGEPVAIHKLMNGEPKMIVNFNLMPLKDAIDFADFLIDTTINYQRFETKLKTCGGATDVLVLTKDNAFWHRHKIFKP